MTDRINSLTVILDHDIRDDDVEPLVKAIECFHHVLDVKMNVSDICEMDIAHSRVRRELIDKLLDVLHDK
jgi:hypothetical protein